MSIVEIIALGLMLLAGGWSLGLGGRIGALLITLTAAVLAGGPEPADMPRQPGPSPRPGLVGSDACAACHPGAHASWQDTYHRTMTRPATVETVLGDFAGVELSDRGLRLRLEETQDGRFRAHVIDGAGRVARSADIALTTGSHHLQNYWLDQPGGWYVQLPFVWMIAEKRWLPVQDSFLQPDSPTLEPPAVWNDSCVYCHTVGGAGRVSADGTRSAVGVGELGISCEACHGPGAAHVAAQRNPIERYRLHLDPDARAEGAARPDRFDHRREVAVCGQCHGIFARTAMKSVNQEADRFTVGDPLAETRQLVLPVPHPTDAGALLIPPAEGPVAARLSLGAVERSAHVIGYANDGIHIDLADDGGYAHEGNHIDLVDDGEARGRASLHIGDLRIDGRLSPRPGGALLVVDRPGEVSEALPHALGWIGQAPIAFDLGAFWGDGTIRSTGREANGLARTACYTEGSMTCGSCHRMHGAPPADQLAPGMDGDGACIGCHPQIDAAAHSHHAAESTGARCMNCHMPYSTFGLLGGIRSHRIDSPTALMSSRYGRPNACNLCHVDRTLAWTAEHLDAWYGQPAPALAAPWDRVSAVALWALLGDGAQRAVAVAALGRVDARDAGGEWWSVPILARLLDDDYAAVRKVAADGLAALGLLPDGYDFVGPPVTRRAARADVLKAWADRAPDRTGPAVLVSGQGAAEDSAIDRLRAMRDRRPITISE